MGSATAWRVRQTVPPDRQTAPPDAVKIKPLPPGLHTCAVTRLKDRDDTPLCRGRFLPRPVTVE